MWQLEMLAMRCLVWAAAQDADLQGAMYAGADTSQTIATLVPASFCLPPAYSLSTWVRGTLTWNVLMCRPQILHKQIQPLFIANTAYPVPPASKPAACVVALCTYEYLALLILEEHLAVVSAC